MATSAEKQARRETLTRSIEETHDMQQTGQTWQWEACGVTGKDVCLICGLTHTWGRNGQNTESFDRYQDSDGDALTLAEASRLPCE